jgi:hypothetical protein
LVGELQQAMSSLKESMAHQHSVNNNFVTPTKNSAFQSEFCLEDLEDVSNWSDIVSSNAGRVGDTSSSPRPKPPEPPTMPPPRFSQNGNSKLVISTNLKLENDREKEKKTDNFLDKLRKGQSVTKVESNRTDILKEPSRKTLDTSKDSKKPQDIQKDNTTTKIPLLKEKKDPPKKSVDHFETSKSSQKDIIQTKTTTTPATVTPDLAAIALARANAIFEKKGNVNNPTNSRKVDVVSESMVHNESQSDAYGNDLYSHSYDSAKEFTSGNLVCI